MPLNSLAWNSHSVMPKLHELSRFVDEHKIDILFLSETWLKPTSQFYLTSFDCYRVDRHYGGVAILIKKSIPHSFSKKVSFPFAEAVSIKVFDGNREFTLSSIYCSPAASREQAKQFFAKALSLSGPHTVAGDFNAKHSAWNNSTFCRKGSDLLKLTTSKSFVIHAPDGPTLLPPRGNPSVVDFAISKNMHGISDPKVFNEMSSDHFPITFSIPYMTRLSDGAKVYNFQKANWKKFRSFLDASTTAFHSRLNKLDTAAKIDNCIQSLSRLIKSATDLSIPKKFPFKPRFPFSDVLKMLTKERNHYRNLYKHTLDPTFKSLTNQLNKLIKLHTNKLKQESFNERIAELVVEDNSLFQLTKALKSKKVAMKPLNKIGGDMAYTDADKAEALADGFLNCHLITSNSISRHDPKVKQSVRKIRADVSQGRRKLFVRDHKNDSRMIRASEGAPEKTQVPAVRNNDPLENYMNSEISEPPDFRFKVSDTISIIEALNVKKAPGPDEISNKVLRNVPKSTAMVLTSIYNACLSISYFPTLWKSGKIVAIPKPGKDLSDPKSYRPISLLSNIGKVFERLILIQLQAHEEKNKIFIAQQFGFRSEHSTVQQILRITEETSLGFNRNRSTGMVLLDLEKAFDSVWHDGLLHKLSKANFPLPLLGLIDSFLQDRKSFVSVNGNRSSTFNVPAGVPQGSILSPFLFNIFINDIPLPKDCHLAIFADDTSIFCNVPWKNAKKVKNILVDALEKVSTFFSDWKIKLNASKTEFIVFTQSPVMARRLKEHPPIFGGKTFEWKDCVTYLGVDLNRKLNFQPHIDKVVAKARKMVCTLYCLLKKNNSVSVESKIAIYRSIIRPIMTYACPIFSNCPKTHFRKLQIQQNKCLRMALNAEFDTRITTLHTESKVPTIREFVDKLSDQFYKSSTTHSNKLISNLGLYTLEDVGGRAKHRLPRLI